MPVPPRVLIAEDEPAVAEFLATTARALGYTVDVGLDGRAALDAAAANPPQIAFVDALLPKVDGFQVLRELRAAQPDLPVVMMSGVYKKRTYRDEAVDALGARDYLHKPLSVGQVWKILEHHVGPAGGSEVPEGFPGASLREVPLPQRLAEAALEKTTGLLFVRGDGGTAVLYFDEGQLVFARSNDPASRLDRVLKASGVLAPEQAARARRLIAENKTGRRFGELLVQEGLITEEQLREALVEQVRVHVTRPFTWKNGASQFLASDAPRHEPFKVAFDAIALVGWGCRQLPSDERLLGWLPLPEQRLRLTQESEAVVPRLGLSEHELQLVNLVDGQRTVAEIRSIGRLAQVDIDRVLAMLHFLRGVRALEPPDETSPRAEPMRLFVPSAGDLARTSPAQVIVAMALAGRTGTVDFERREKGQLIRRQVHFEDGKVAFAASNHPADRIGQVLVGRGIVTRDELQAALETAKTRPGVALGRVLVDEGILRLERLHEALLAQVVKVLAGLFGWRDGTFHFRDGALPMTEIVPLGLKTLPIVLDGLRTCPFGDLAPSLPPRDTLIGRTEHGFDLAPELKLTSLEDRVLLATEQPKPVHELLAKVDDEPEDILRAVYCLLQVGLAEGHQAPAGTVIGQAGGAGTPAAPRAPARVQPADEFDDLDRLGETPDGATNGTSRSSSSGTPAVALDDESFGDEFAEAGVGDAGFEAPTAHETCDESFGSLGDDDFVAGGTPAVGGFANAPAGDEAFAPSGPAAPSQEPPDFSLDGELDDSRLDDSDFEAFARDVEGALGGPLGGSETPARSASPPATGTAASASAASATAVLEEPARVPVRALAPDEQAAIEDFLSRLAFHLSVNPGLVPAEVLAALPDHLRRRFGL